MNNLLLLILCFIVGMVLHRFKRMPENAPATLNSFIIHVSLPALTLLYIHDVQFSSTVFLTALMAWLVFGFSVLFFYYVGRFLALPRATVGTLMLLGGLGNTSFFGLPMVEAFYGSAAITTAIVADLLGSFFVLSILGISVAGWYSHTPPTALQLLKRIAIFPPFLALLVALILLPVDYADWFSQLLKRLGDTLAPLALLSVGLQLRLGDFASVRRNVLLGLSFKLLLAPLSVYLLYVQLLGARGEAIQVTLFEAAMPPMITAAIIAAEHHLDAKLANLMVAIGLLISFASLTLWYWLLHSV